MGLTSAPTSERAAAALPRRRIGVLGGSFDPVHVGHLALAASAQAALRLDEILFVPAGIAWQKDGAAASAAERTEMLRLALSQRPGWSIDEREIRRGGPSYTIDTLRELRGERGPEPALVLLLGSDQFRNLETWHEYAELSHHGHIAVTRRGPARLTDLPERLEALLAQRGTDALPDAPSGSIVLFTMPPVPVSSSGIRTQLAAGEKPEQLLPPGVLDYIERKRLYRRR